MKSLRLILAVAAAGTLLAACGGSSKKGPQISGKVPSGYRTISEHIGSTTFQFAVPSSWKSSAVTSTKVGSHVVLLSPNGASLTDTAQVSANKADVLVSWTAKTPETVAAELSANEAAESAKKITSKLTGVGLAGTKQAVLLTQSYTNESGAGRSSILVAGTKGGGLIDVEAVWNSSEGSAFNPTGTVDSVKVN
jgi:hypothetical protein